MVTAAEWNAIERRFGADAAEEWQLVLRQFEFGEGFALLVVTVPDRGGAQLCRGELEAWLRPQGKHLARVEPETPAALRDLATTLLALSVDAAVGAVWVAAAVSEQQADHAAWSDAWRHALGSLNQQRNPLRRRFTVPLILVGAHWLVPVMREIAPDLWSVRALVARIEPGRDTDNSLGERLDLGRSAGQAWEPAGATAPDPAFALQAAERLRGRSGQEPALAELLARAGRGFAARGALDEAKAAWREAAELYRALAAQRPDAFRPNLAASLSNLANMLSDLGEREAALAAAREAVELRRALAAQRPDAFRPDLAMSLNNLANRLSDLGEREAALAAAREAAELYRALAAQRPDTFRPNLATSLMVRARCLDAADQPAQALADNAEAISVLTPAFVRLPPAFAQLMGVMRREYLQRCEKSGADPDQALLAPVIATFNSLQGPRGESA